MTKLQQAIAERDEARQIVKDIYWMALRYADQRMSYAPKRVNDAVEKGYRGGWLDPNPANTPRFASCGTTHDYGGKTL